MKLLIVEDSTLLIDRLTKLINLVDGVEIVGNAGTVEDTLKQIMTYRPDFIILDVLLEGENVLEHLHKVYELVPNVIIAVFTNYPYNVFKKLSSENGIKHFFDKSKDLEGILELIKSYAAEFKKR